MSLILEIFQTSSCVCVCVRCALLLWLGYCFRCSIYLCRTKNIEINPVSWRKKGTEKENGNSETQYGDMARTQPISLGRLQLIAFFTLFESLVICFEEENWISTLFRCVRNTGWSAGQQTAFIVPFAIYDNSISFIHKHGWNTVYTSNGYIVACWTLNVYFHSSINQPKNWSKLNQ